MCSGTFVMSVHLHPCAPHWQGESSQWFYLVLHFSQVWLYREIPPLVANINQHHQHWAPQSNCGYKCLVGHPHSPSPFDGSNEFHLDAFTVSVCWCVCVCGCFSFYRRATATTVVLPLPSLAFITFSPVKWQNCYFHLWRQMYFKLQSS